MGRVARRFQTGREIMEAYIPGYTAQPRLGAPTGEELARVLLQSLETRLRAKEGQKTPSRRRRRAASRR